MSQYITTVDPTAPTPPTPAHEHQRCCSPASHAALYLWLLTDSQDDPDLWRLLRAARRVLFGGN